MTDDDFRDIALSMHGAIEGSHMGHPDFRANGRIFATLRRGRTGHTGDQVGMVKLSPEEQREVMRDHPRAFEPSPGAWGRQGCTDVRLEAASRAAVRGAMVLAWEAVVAKPPAPRRRAKKKPGKLILVVGGLGLLGAFSGLSGTTVSGQTGGPPRALHSSQASVASVARVDFRFQIRPLLSDRCFRCHGPDASKRKAKLRLDTREGAFKDIDDGWSIVKPGDPSRSELIRRINSDFEDDVMPPPESHLSLSEAEKALLKRWIVEGADYQPHWSLIPVHAVEVPASGIAATNPIDAFVRARLARSTDGESWRPAPRASPETLLRRLAFNLTGLPPTPAELEAFTADGSPTAYARAVERYLASPGYGERMAMDWLDLARYADTYGYQADVERDMSPYRDWVINAFNRNLPYDQFLVWQLAGDLLPNPTREQRIATAFNRLHRQTNEGGSIEAEFRTEYVVDRVNTFGTAMLGLTLECARCHDHKFDPITQRDYYSLFAFFNNIDESGLYSHFTNATPSPSLLLWPDRAKRQHDSVNERIAATEARLTALSASARPAFAAWLKTAQVTRPQPIAHLGFDVVHGDQTPDNVLSAAAQIQDGVVPVQEASIAALRFSGDSPVVHADLRPFVRTDAFSLSLRLKPTEKQDRAVILHQSRAWSDAGSRGFELTLDEGRPFFGLIHFWPGNAIAVRAKRSLPLNEWSRLVVTYDGSSRASGIRLYLNEAPLETEILTDHLYKDISYRREAGDRSADTHPLTIGARFRDSGFKNGLIDDLQVFDICLTAVEVAGTIRRDPGDAAALAYFLARHHQASVAARAELRALREQENQLVADIPEIMVMEEMPTPRPAHLLARGAYDAPGIVVSRETPPSLPPFPSGQPRNRLGLARWLVDRRNPLAARVVVNRIWRMHFGRGLVGSQEDFGSQGKLPTNPALLDWLAGRFMDIGWDVKALHRLIVSSETFRQSSQAPRELTLRDPDNLLLARGPKTRLMAEEIRDSALAASGLLNHTIGGPSVKPYQPAGLWEQSGTGKTYVQDKGLKLYRRSLYTFWRRTSPPPSMLTFDGVSREVCTARRDITATPLQALVLLNDPQFVEAARVLAERLLTKFPNEPDARTSEAFRALIGRQPDETEARILGQLFAEQKALFSRNPENASRWLSAGDSTWDETLPRADFAAMATVVSAIMNVEEFVVLR
jgi:Protein of unknown function (DUF1553)/Protein of unknown function (DUF1549)/Planctomycete cytochrome C/Concanavalin A-like lectin/glucanases superfamily